uniref:Stanniocalcin n=1 Tax=Cyprinodon variegatus TaxID=28743 RepID=A0A3Q2CZV3_CYPVA
MKVNVSAVMFLLLGFNQLLAMELHDHILEKQGSQVKRRLSLQSTAEIQSCLVSSGDVGCGMFQCFSNNSCEIHGLHHICLTLLHNAGRYDSQGKSYVKDALRCMALGLRQRFSCVSRRCSAVKEMVFSLQRECYSKHHLCLAVRDHLDTMGNLVQPYVELMNFLLKCGGEIRTWVGRRLRGQCEQHWGGLCSTFINTCPHSQSDPTSPPPFGSPDVSRLSTIYEVQSGTFFVFSERWCQYNSTYMCKTHKNVHLKGSFHSCKKTHLCKNVYM